MRRLFWMGVGAAGAVVAASRVRRAVRRVTPEGVAEQIEDAGRRTGTALRDAVGVFRAASREREDALVTALLVEPSQDGTGAPVDGGATRGRHAVPDAYGV